MLGILEGLSILGLFTIKVSLVSWARVLCNINLDLIPPESLRLTPSVVQGFRSPRAETGTRKQTGPSLLVKKIKRLKCAVFYVFVHSRVCES